MLGIKTIGALGAVVLCVTALCGAQTLKLRTPEERNQQDARQAPPKEAAAPVVVDMTVPAGTPIKVALDSEVRVRRAGQPIHGKTVEAIYAFNKLLIPAGTTVTGKVSAIDPVSKKTRTLQAMDGNFSPVRKIHVQFDDVVMSDGRRLPIQTATSPAPEGVLKFVPSDAKAAKKKNRVQDAASKKVSEARQQMQQQWSDLQKQIHTPGKMHKLKRLLIAQLPVRPQYLDAGMTFNADLIEPLEFGKESIKVDELTQIGTPPPSGSVVHARLTTPLSSASSKKGEPVEAVITEPLVASDHLILPEGSVIRGNVVEAQPARRLARNGQLRILFHEVRPPNGVEEKVVTSLEAVAVANGQNLKLDREGGAQATTPKTRYLTTGVQVMLAATSARPDSDARGGGGGGDFTGSAANGVSGFRFVGMAISMAARSRIVASAFGSYGAANAIYYHFLARGHDVVYPKDMGMVIGLGSRDSTRASVERVKDGSLAQSNQ
ncbi:MAG TPA: hypothetical protein VGS27_16155 [Candidatus Sulfotelmatobacter sp.]|nr:hypothetical protein [Candidatus Sulfotelmatobacter sp.]